MSTIPEVDDYIASCAEWARPILERFRNAARAASTRIEEEIKWGVPNFTHHGIVANMAAFKNHVTVGFWRAKDLSDPEGLLTDSKNGAMCGMKITSLEEVPPQRVLVAYFKEAMALNEKLAAGRAASRKSGKKKKASTKTARKLDVPDWFTAALKKNRKARATFESFAWSYQRDYVQWLLEAKRETTRARRLETAIEWLAEGKHRNWKYE